MTDPRTFTFDESDRQAIVLALACLSLQRPGWEQYLGDLASKLQARHMFREFRLYNSNDKRITDPMANPPSYPPEGWAAAGISGTSPGVDKGS